MSKNFAVVGAGIVGRLLALRLHASGHRVTLYEKAGWHNPNACSYAAAGMIAPYCELETAEFLVARIGVESLEMWTKIVADLGSDIFYSNRGSLVIAYRNDALELSHLRRRIAGHPLENRMEELDGPGIAEIEPELAGKYTHGLFYPLEAALDNRGVLRALANKICATDIDCHMATLVTEIAPGLVVTEKETQQFDLVFDCRAMGAKSDLKELRGVRGELVIVDAPAVNLQRPIRLLHPRYPVYIVPHGDSRYFIGATAIETEDDGPITVRTSMELLSAAYEVHAGFAEARILETVTNLRPAFMDNTPKVRCRKGLIQINGLYRHGFLMSPRIIEGVMEYIKSGHPDAGFGEIFEQLDD